jgi:hypothetical protein
MRDLAALCLVLAALPGTLELVLLSIGALLPRRKERTGPLGRTPRLAVIVPAHDEELGIARCVESLLASDPHVDVVVVADNCSDATAARAATAGARVLVREHADLRGKGFALEHAFRVLGDGVRGEGGYEAFVVIDADSIVDPDFVPVCRRWFAAGADALQTRYEVLNADETLRTRFMRLAFLAFNVLRPRARERMGLSVGIFGNGFGITRATLEAVPYRAHSLVEDLEFHVALVRAGRRVRFAEDTCVRAEMPVDAAGAGSQRARWEGGRLGLLFTSGPRLAVDVLRGRGRLVEPLLDLLLAPLAWHVLVLCVALGLAQGTLATSLACAGLAAVVAHVGLALAVGRATATDLAVLCLAPFYVAWKVVNAPRILAAARPSAAWVRTRRTTRNVRDRSA